MDTALPIIQDDPAHPAQTTLVVRDGTLLLDAALQPPQLAALALTAALDNGQRLDAPGHAVLAPDGARYAVAWVDADWQAPADCSFVGLRTLLLQEHPLFEAASRAVQVGEWARTHRHCGACGAPTQLVPGERCLRCTRCGHGAYPRVSPAMMVLVRRDQHLLLAQHSAPRSNALFTALAGFVEAGESLEDCVHREVMEEVGLQVRNLRYFGSQSWPFPHSLMLAFTAEYAGGELRLSEEIAEAAWFDTRAPMPPIPAPQTVSGRLIRSVLGQHDTDNPDHGNQMA